MHTRLGALALVIAVGLAGCGGSKTPAHTNPAAANGTTSTPGAVTASGQTTTSAPASTKKHTHAVSSTSSSMTSTTAGGSRVLAGEWNAASLFADAYVNYLDGNGQAPRLPYATAGVRSAAEQTGPIPAKARSGTLRLLSLRPAKHSLPDSFYLTARDSAHTYGAQVQLAKSHGAWRVVQLLPPDYDQVLAPKTKQRQTLPSGSAPSHTDALAFLSGYLPWLYAQASVRAIKDASAPLIKQLKAHPPNVPPTMTHLHPRASAVGMVKDKSGWLAEANISDGETTYQLNLVMVKLHGDWVVTKVQSP